MAANILSTTLERLDFKCPDAWPKWNNNISQPQGHHKN